MNLMIMGPTVRIKLLKNTHPIKNEVGGKDNNCGGLKLINEKGNFFC